MLGHPATASRNDKSRSRGDVEKVGPIAAGTHNIHQGFAGNRNPGGQFTHHHYRRGNLIQGLAFQAHCHQESAYLRVAGLTGHDLTHDALHLIEGKIAAVSQLGK